VGSSAQLIRQDSDPSANDGQIQALKEEIRTLRQKVHSLRRRDETVRFFMNRLDEELRLAARLQRDFLPKELPRLGPVTFHALFRPAGYVSGDLYDVFRLDETHMGFYLVDAMGHGVPAALLTMFLRTSLVTKEINADGYRILSPGDALGRLNTAVAGQTFSQTTFATAVYGIIDCQSGDVSMSRAGHPMPVLLSGEEGLTQRLNCGGGALLGVFPGEVFATESICMKPGDRLFIHSDGIDVVFPDDAGLDDRAWRNELTRMRGSNTAAILNQFSAYLDAQTGSLQPKDDLTVIAVEVEK
jgi:sigma-B regulation protein RsbU (phosphoserine phosphatase)